MTDAVAADDVRKLLDNGWTVLLFKNDLGSYTAVACKPGQQIADAIDKEAQLTDDFTPSQALHRLAEKVTQSGEYQRDATES